MEPNFPQPAVILFSRAGAAAAGTVKTEPAAVTSVTSSAGAETEGAGTADGAGAGTAACW